MVGNLLMHTESAGYSTQILACDTVNCARRLHLVIGLTQFRYTHTVRTNFWESERIHIVIGSKTLTGLISILSPLNRPTNIQ